ncbi:MAG: phage tail sheath C-terminal domain-containing protein, partial [Rhodanobacter sp.]
AINAGSCDVTGTGTLFTSELGVGQWITFGSGASHAPYGILAIDSDTSLTLTGNHTGATVLKSKLVVTRTTATRDYGLVLSTAQPAVVPAGLPVVVKIIAKDSVLPTTLSGVATQIQQAINAVLALQMPGAALHVSVMPLPATPPAQALRINALLPASPDAVISMGDPEAATGLAASVALLGLGESANVAHYTLGTGNTSWGQQTTSTKGVDGGLPATADIVGDQAAFSGIYALMKVDLFNLLCIPDATRASASDPTAPDPSVNTNAIYSAAIALCDQRRAFLLLDAPPNVTSVASAVDWKTSQLTVVDPNGAAFFPRVCLFDALNHDQLRTFAPCGVVAGVYATTDGSHGVWKSPAGTGAVLIGVQDMSCKLSDLENGVLNPLGLNCFRTFPAHGAVLWGARTLVGADTMSSQWKYVPVRRTALFIEESLYRGTQWVVFEQNDEPLWASIRLNVGTFMHDLFLKGAFQGSTATQAYFIKCDSQTTSQTDMENGIVNMEVGFAPLRPAEFVVLRIEQMSARTT